MVHLLKTVQPNLTSLPYPHFLPITNNADGVCISKSAAPPDHVTFIVFSDSVEATTKICKSGVHSDHNTLIVYLLLTVRMTCVFLRVQPAQTP